MSIHVQDRFEEPIVDLRVLLAQLSARRWWIVASVVVATVAFTVAAFVITPVYRAATVLVPASAERDSLSSSLSSALGSLGGFASLAGVGLDSTDRATEEALAVLRSREFTERFILEMKLMPELFADKWNAAASGWKGEPDDRPTPAKAFKYFSRHVRTVIQDKKTGLVTLQVDWKDRNKAAAWANELARRLNAEMRARAIEKAQASMAFLEKELADTSVVETRQAINRLMEAQIRQRMLANVTEEYAFRVVDQAMPSDADDPLKPKKLVLLALGPIVGLVFSVVCILAFGALLPGPRAAR
jgi:uncharacterized protein involved in exopolysaccharide biosynthesis